MKIHICIITHNNEKTISNIILLLNRINPSKIFIFDNNSIDKTIQTIENTQDNIEIVKHTTNCDTQVFFYKKVSYFIRNNISDCNYFSVFNANFILNEKYIDNFSIQNNIKNYYGLASVNNNILVKFPFLLSTEDEWLLDNNNDIINISNHIQEYIFDTHLSYIESYFWDGNITTEQLILKQPDFVKDPAILFKVCNGFINQQKVEHSLYYFQLFNYSLSLSNYNKNVNNDNLYFLCYRIIELFLNKKYYNKEVAMEISKIAITTSEYRAEIYHFLGIFFYQIQNYYLSLYFFENAINKKLYQIYNVSDKIFPPAYKLESNYLILISAFLSNNRKIYTYLSTYKKHCSHISYIHEIIDCIDCLLI
tara:strand:- start:737 stop:1831 length:1095 start_codon:yes stop_codon:yes gene_type:complete